MNRSVGSGLICISVSTEEEEEEDDDVPDPDGNPRLNPLKKSTSIGDRNVVFSDIPTGSSKNEFRCRRLEREKTKDTHPKDSRANPASDTDDITDDDDYDISQEDDDEENGYFYSDEAEGEDNSTSQSPSKSPSVSPRSGKKRDLDASPKRRPPEHIKSLSVKISKLDLPPMLRSESVSVEKMGKRMTVGGRKRRVAPGSIDRRILEFKAQGNFLSILDQLASKEEEEERLRGEIQASTICNKLKEIEGTLNEEGCGTSRLNRTLDQIFSDWGITPIQSSAENLMNLFDSVAQPEQSTESSAPSLSSKKKRYSLAKAKPDGSPKFHPVSPPPGPVTPLAVSSLQHTSSTYHSLPSTAGILTARRSRRASCSWLGDMTESLVATEFGYIVEEPNKIANVRIVVSLDQSFYRQFTVHAQYMYVGYIA
eukprot:TRINITY_DN2015_c0_g1_i1.p1 TRINITY_DN2015_c0_g1~~TRINITY_DN2015_c0_g1_i1.p1  ORF type:complete len:425 (-),score=108.42 TRINITY_DN2015_c0_g1_i1:457-1731(-)